MYREKKIENTYCNPLTLPDYPSLPVLNQPPANPMGMALEWGREGKEVVSEFDLAMKIDRNLLPFDPEGGLPDFGEYFREGENDVRATADPSVMYYDGKWYLYCTSGYVYDSEDFIHWNIHPEPSFKEISAPMAPTVEHFRGKFYATANSVPLHVSDSPLGPWKLLGEWLLPDGRIMMCNDPMIFADDDDRLYLYFGLGCGIFGVELDPEKPNQFLAEPKLLANYNAENEWERMGNRNEQWHTGCIEGSWMYKHNGTYYLLYSVCGTEYYRYCMGAYVCDKPLGDFKLQARNPVSRSNGGLVRGGGHGSIVDGPNGTIWCFYTIPVVIDHIHERRIGMDPCGIDEKGCLYALTGSETPQWAPGVLEHPENGNDTGLVPCTYFDFTKASSYHAGNRPLYAIDECLHTWWQPEDGDSAPSLAVSLRTDFYISAARIIWKDVGLDFGKGIMPGAYKYVLEAAQLGDNWVTIVDASENETDLTVDYRTFPEVRTNVVRIRILGAPEGVTPGIINLSVFGEHAWRREKYGHEPYCAK